MSKGRKSFTYIQFFFRDYPWVFVILMIWCNVKLCEIYCIQGDFLNRTNCSRVSPRFPCRTSLSAIPEPVAPWQARPAPWPVRMAVDRRPEWAWPESSICHRKRPPRWPPWRTTSASRCKWQRFRPAYSICRLIRELAVEWAAFPAQLEAGPAYRRPWAVAPDQGTLPRPAVPPASCRTCRPAWPSLCTTSSNSRRRTTTCSSCTCSSNRPTCTTISSNSNSSSSSSSSTIRAAIRWPTSPVSVPAPVPQPPRRQWASTMRPRPRAVRCAAKRLACTPRSAILAWTWPATSANSRPAASSPRIWPSWWAPVSHLPHHRRRQRRLLRKDRREQLPQPQARMHPVPRAVEASRWNPLPPLASKGSKGRVKRRKW